MGGGGVSSLTGKRPSWAGCKRPRKRVDVVGIRKKVEMGETGCKSKHAGGGGGQNQTCFITRAVTGSPHTPRSPTGAQGIAQSTFLTTSKICGIRAKKNTLRRKKLSHLFFLARSISFFSTQYFFQCKLFFWQKKKYNLFESVVPHHNARPHQFGAEIRQLFWSPQEYIMPYPIL